MATIEQRLGQRPIQEKKNGINKRLAALALTGAIALGGVGAFIGSQQGEHATPEPTPISGGVGNTNQETPGAIDNNSGAVDSEGEVGSETDPKAFTINTWLDMLSSKQSSDENDKYLNFEIKNKDEWKSSMTDSGNQTEPLKVSWVGGFTTPSPIEDGKYYGNKMVGSAEFNNVTLTVNEQEISAADKANGYTFKGVAKISYAERYSNTFFQPENQEDTGERDSVLQWIHAPQEGEATFTEWEDESVKFPIALVNGKWTAKLDNLYQEANSTPVEDYNDFLMPIKSFYTVGCGEQQESCKIVHQDLPY
jgi:hypothetical protein